MTVVEDPSPAARVELAVLAPILVPLVVVSLVMVFAMVQVNRALIVRADVAFGWVPRREERATWLWAALYLLSWGGIAALALRLIEIQGSPAGGKAWFLLFPLAFLFWNVCWVALVRAMIRRGGSARRPAASRTPAPAPRETPAEPSWRPHFKNRLLSALRVAGEIALVLLVIAVGELIPQLAALEAYLAEHRDSWLPPALVLALLGTLGLAGGGLQMALSRDLGEADRTATFAEVKKAWRTGAWRKKAGWRRLLVMATSAMLLFFGIFGTLFVVAPAGIKLLVLLIVAYALVRTVAGFWRA